MCSRKEMIALTVHIEGFFFLNYHYVLEFHHYRGLHVLSQVSQLEKISTPSEITPAHSSQETPQLRIHFFLFNVKNIFTVQYIDYKHY